MTADLPSIPPDPGVPDPAVPSPVVPSPAVPCPRPSEEDMTPAGHRNEVRLVGLVVVEPSDLALSDDEVVTSWRVAVERPAEQRRPLVGSDTVTCAAGDPAVREVVTSFQLGDTVELSGALRRRASRTTTGVVNFYEVEVVQARLVSSVLLADERPGPRMGPPS